MKITMTRKLLESGKTEKGGYTRAQLDVFGIGWPPNKGWPQLVIGQEVDQEKIDRFLQARNVRAKNSPRTDNQGSLF